MKETMDIIELYEYKIKKNCRYIYFLFYVKHCL